MTTWPSCWWSWQTDHAVTGAGEGTLRDGEGWTYTLTRPPEGAPTEVMQDRYETEVCGVNAYLALATTPRFDPSAM